MGIFGRKKDVPAETPAETAAPDTAALPDGAAAESVDLSTAREAEALAHTPETNDADDALNEQSPSPENKHFYRQPEALSASRHAALGVARGENGFSFARSAHLVPLTLAEFPQAALHYPIIFTGPQRLACAVMGLRSGANLFIDQNGGFEPGAYAPAYLRQYPFLLAKSRQDDRSVLFIDRASDFVIENGGAPLFKDGEPTDFTKGALSFLMSLQNQWADTLAFTQRMNGLGLFDVKELKLSARDASGGVGESKSVVKYVALDTEKLAALPGDELKKLAGERALAAIYAHQTSLYNWSKIISRAFQAQRAAA